MAHSSNRQRIARAADEARATEIEKAAKKASKSSAASPSTGSAAKSPAAKSAAPKAAGTKRVVKPVRVKIVWEVCSSTGTVVATFAYPDKAAAEAKAALLTNSTGRNHSLRGTKVPME